VWILFIWLLDWSDRRSRGRPSPYWQPFILMMIWANTHLTAALGIGVVALWTWNGKNHLEVIKAVGVCFLATLFTPYYGTEWLVLFQKSGHPSDHQAIAEFQPA